MNERLDEINVQPAPDRGAAMKDAPAPDCANGATPRTDSCRTAFEDIYKLYNELTKKDDGTYEDWNLQLTWSSWETAWNTCAAQSQRDLAAANASIESLRVELAALKTLNKMAKCTPMCSELHAIKGGGE
jgi:hypothetical protein